MDICERISLTLNYAANDGHVCIVEYLVERGAGINAEDYVRDAVIDRQLRISRTSTVNTTERFHPVDICGKQWSLSSG